MLTFQIIIEWISQERFNGGSHLLVKDGDEPATTFSHRIDDGA